MGYFYRDVWWLKKYWTNKKVLVTGGKGLFGSQLVEILKILDPGKFEYLRENKVT